MSAGSRSTGGTSAGRRSARRTGPRRGRPHRWAGIGFAVVLVASVVAGCAAPPEDSGISGEVLIGPSGASEATGSAESRPYATELSIKRSGFFSRGVTVETGDNGRFSVNLEPGTYTISAKDTGTISGAEPVEVEVKPGTFTIVTIEFDTGAR